MTEEFKELDAKEILLNYKENTEAYRNGVCVTTTLTYNCLMEDVQYGYNCIGCDIDKCPLFIICDTFENPWSIVK